MRRASISASGSRRHSAGSKPSGACVRASSGGRLKVDWAFTFAAAAYNLARRASRSWRRHDRPGHLWGRDYLDLGQPAYPRIGNDGWAEFAFSAVNATAELEYGRSIVFLHWSGLDEGDEISGDRSAMLQDDGSIEIELSFNASDVYLRR